MWDVSVVGSALSGVTSRVVAARVAFEELGVRLNMKEKRPNFTVNFDQGFDNFYLIEMDKELGDFVLQKEEV